jgi:glycosyltransferase involved in cell wall biosynthesis
LTRRRVLFVGRTRYQLPLPGWLARKWDAVEEKLDYRLLGAATVDSAPSDERFRLARPVSPSVLDAPAFYLGLPFRVRRELRAFGPAAIVASDPIVGAAALVGRRIAGRRTPVIVEVHGDWRTFTRSYGSRARRLVAGLVDRLAEWAIRNADATRAVSSFTGRLVEQTRGEPPTVTFTAYSDLDAFTERPVVPLPERPVVIFVGSLERYKNVEGLAAAWRVLAPRIPAARLIVVGRGSQTETVEALLRDFPDRVEHHPWLDPADVSAAIDRATVLALPSWPEGLGRVVIEAFARGRAVVATDGGGIPDLVDNGVEGFLVRPFDSEALAERLAQVLEDPALAARLGAAAAERFGDWDDGPEELAEHFRDLVERTLAR